MTIYNEFRIYQDIARITNGGRLERVSDTVLEWQPYTNGSIGLYNGSSWEVITPDSNPSAANDATTISGSTLVSGTNYDVFGTPSGTTFNLEFQEWSGDNTRYQNPVRFDGVKVYADTAEGRKKRWLGIIRLDGVTGDSYFTDSETQRFVFNNYNPVDKKARAYLDSSGSYEYTTGSFREANGGEDMVRGELISDGENDMLMIGLQKIDPNGTGYLGLGFNADDSITGSKVQVAQYTGDGPDVLCPAAIVTPLTGYNYITLVEYGYNPSASKSKHADWCNAYTVIRC
jgi:hypothetical protein